MPMKPRHSALFLLVLLVSAGAAAAVEPLIVPRGPAPMVDHRLDDDAWGGAARQTLPDGTEIWAQQDDAYIFIAIKAPAPRVFGMELYVAERPDKIVNLHASAYLGERAATDGKWPEWTWWNAAGWTATIVPYLVEGADRKFIALAGKEFQLSKSRFGNARYPIRIDCHYSRNGASMTYPPDTGEFVPAGWLELVLR